MLTPISHNLKITNMWITLIIDYNTDYSGARKQSVLEAVIEAGKRGKDKDLGAFDKGQIAEVK